MDSKITSSEIEQQISIKSKNIIRRLITKHDREEIARRYNFKCGYCNRKVDVIEGGELDDFFPIIKYPDKAMDRENLVYCCSYCNRIKGSRDPINGSEKVIIDPRYDKFDEHIEELQSGFLNGKTELGKKTIDFFNLNRNSMLEQRIGSTIMKLMENEDYNSAEPIINNDKSPYEKFMESMQYTKELLNIKIEEDVIKKHQLKLLYANVITAMETYLSDTFIKNVIYSDENLKRFVKTFHEYKDEKINYADIFDKYDNIQTYVTKSLLDVLYHNLNKVKGMYKTTLNIDFTEDITFLFKAVNIRHDIVHRNGRDKDGNEHNIIESIIEENISEVKKLIDHIENQLNFA